MPYSYQVTRIEKLMIMKLVTIYILILMLLLSCTSKKDSNTQATIDSLSIYDNHPILEIIKSPIPIKPCIIIFVYPISVINQFHIFYS